MSPQKRWEYRFIAGPRHTGELNDVEQTLNSLGDSGWEVVASVDVPRESAHYAPVLLLKRRC